MQEKTNDTLVQRHKYALKIKTKLINAGKEKKNAAFWLSTLDNVKEKNKPEKEKRNRRKL